MTDAPTRAGPAWREADRQRAVEDYGVLDTAPELAFDDLAGIASQITGAPIALITFLDHDRQWFKSAVGTDLTGTPRQIAFCDHAIRQDGVMIVPDASADARFADNPLVTGDTHVRFYAGAPIVADGGLPLGTVCVLDSQPRTLAAEQVVALEALARLVRAQLDLRRSLHQRRVVEARQRRILESAVDYAIISMNPAGQVDSWNEGACRIFGWTEDEMLGQHCDKFFTPEDRAADVPQTEMRTALQAGRASDERWHLQKTGERFWASGEMMPLTDEGGVVGFLKIVRDRTQHRRADEALADAAAVTERDRQMVAHEAQHRVKNILGLAQAVVASSLRTADNLPDARRAVEARLSALGRAHDMLMGGDQDAISIREAAALAVETLGQAVGRISFDGPELQLSPRAVVGLALALHELGTNAVKYGALSTEAGRVALTWSVEGVDGASRFTIEWREMGGPAVTAPARKGFGSRLLRTPLAGSAVADVTLDYDPTGVVWRSALPLADVTEDLG